MKLPTIFSACLNQLLLTACIFSSTLNARGAEEALFHTSLDNFGEAAYARAVKQCFEIYERGVGHSLQPGPKNKIALKIFTYFGSGLATPKNLVKACIDELKLRGFRDIVIVDALENNLRESGYLPPLSEKNVPKVFYGARVIASETCWDDQWIYESKVLPPFLVAAQSVFVKNDQRYYQSHLPKTLITDVDYWINLPVAVHNNALGISGCIANSSLYAADNCDRFFTDAITGCVAAAEMAAVPELRKTYLFSLVSLEFFQILDTGSYNAYYVASEKQLVGGTNMVAVDANIYARFNAFRVMRSLKELSDKNILFNYASQVGLGEI